MIENQFIPGALLCLPALIVWALVAVRSSTRAAARREALEQRVRDAAQAHLASGSPFGQGAAAALLGEEFWTNPHCTPTGLKDKGLAWNAGWCYGHRLLRDYWRAED
jgi:hypothetical protein